MLEFTGFAEHPPDLVVRLLTDAYMAMPPIVSQELQAWEAYAKLIHDCPDTVGASGFVSCIGGQAIGFASWDPRQGPELVVVGHNCITPPHRGKGYGILQMAEELARLREAGFRNAVVSTGAGESYLPARRMYSACGFREVRRQETGLSQDRPDCIMVHYELVLSGVVPSA